MQQFKISLMGIILFQSLNSFSRLPAIPFSLSAKTLRNSHSVPQNKLMSDV